MLKKLKDARKNKGSFSSTNIFSKIPYIIPKILKLIQNDFIYILKIVFTKEYLQNNIWNAIWTVNYLIFFSLLS